MHVYFVYIWGINPLSVTLFTIICSQYEDYAFTLFIVSFAVQKLLSIIRSHLFTFVIIYIILGGGSDRILLWFMSKSILPMSFMWWLSCSVMSNSCNSQVPLSMGFPSKNIGLGFHFLLRGIILTQVLNPGFILYGITFKSLIQFEFIICTWCLEVF